MKLLLLLLSFATLSFAQSVTSENLLTNKSPCTFELTIDQLVASDLSFKCAEAFENKPFKIKNFKIKFIGNAAIPVLGNVLNKKSIKLAEKAKIGDIVVLFHIENTIVGKEKSKIYKTLAIKIIA